jgi:N4-gp56 family major capsid protein
MSNMLLSSAARINCVGGVNNDSPSELTSDDCDAAIQSLLNANAWTIQDFVEAENKFGTAPVRAAYLALASTKIQPDLEKVDGFIAANQYPSPMNLLRTEWGAVRNLRFHLSTLGSVIQNASLRNRDVYAITFAGLEAAACVKQDGMSAKFIYLPPEIVGGPLAQNCSVGWKMAQVCRIKNDQWIGNLMCTTTI